MHAWESRYTAGQDAYLLENGHLLRAANLGENEAFFAGTSQGGRIQEFTWDGELIWDYKFHNEKQIRHHSITRLPNGNILMNVWERKTPAEFIVAGLKSAVAGTSDVLTDAIYEVQPSGKTGGKIVWEWHLWDHLIQDNDSTKANFGDVAAHAELVDINFARGGVSGFANLARFAVAPLNQPEPKKDDAKTPDDKKSNAKKSDAKKDDPLDRLKGLGYVGAAGGKKFAGFLPDWVHGNSVAYNAQLDQVVLSAREFSEIWIIDHSTTTAEAAGHNGGKHGKGGDLLYRWGNPQAYRAGTAKDQRLFNQHDAHWIPDGLPGAGHLLVFNNGSRRPNDNYSSADETVLPVIADGEYERKVGARFGPEAAARSYTAQESLSFSRRSWAVRSGCPTATRSSAPGSAEWSSKSMPTMRSSGDMSIRPKRQAALASHNRASGRSWSRRAWSRWAGRVWPLHAAAGEHSSDSAPARLFVVSVAAQRRAAQTD